MGKLSAFLANHRAWRRGLVVLMVTLLFLEVAYVVAAQWFLHKPNFDRIVNGDPFSVYLRYDSAWSVFPGLAHVRGFIIEGQSDDVKWHVEVEKIRVWVNIFAIPARKFRALSVAAEGGGFTLATGQAPRPTPEPPPSPDDKGPFKVDIANIDIRGFDRIQVEGYEYRGPGRVEGSFFLYPGRELQVRRGRVSFAGGEVRLADKPIATGLEGSVLADIRDWYPDRHSNAEIFDKMTAHVVLAGTLGGAEFLNHYFRSVPWFRMSEISGSFRADTRFRDGVFEAPSSGEITASEMGGGIGPYQARGRGQIAWGLRDKALDLSIELKDYEVFARPSNESFMKGAKLGLKTRHHALGVRRIFSDASDLDAELDLPKASITDLRFVNAFIPTGILRVDRGTGDVEARLSLSTLRPAPGGYVRTRTRGTRLSYKNVSLSGDIEVDTKFADTETGTESFDVSGTALRLANLRVERPKAASPKPPWAGSLRLSRGELTPWGGHVFRGRAELSFDNARPIFAILAADSVVARIVAQMTDVKDMRGGSDFAMGPGVMEFTKLKITSSDLKVEGDLQFLERTQNLRALVEFGVLTLGLDVVRGETHTKVVGARDWLKRRPAWRPFVPPPMAR